MATFGIGKYGLDTIALQQAGLVKLGTPGTREALDNPNNWLGKNGINSIQDFFNNTVIQDQVMFNYTALNYQRLQELGIITDTTSTEEVAGLLSAAHISTPELVAQWYQSADTTDTIIDGKRLSSFFNLGRYSQTQTEVIIASQEAKSLGGS